VELITAIDPIGFRTSAQLVEVTFHAIGRTKLLPKYCGFDMLLDLVVSDLSE
jgi:hypothetical protein